MDLELIANRILAITEKIDPETRYEEKSWVGPNGLVVSTNVALRSGLGAPCGEQRYPDGRACDIVFKAEYGPVWIESKHSWTWRTYRRPGDRNPTYRKHLLGGDGNSVLNDARTKLPQLVGHPWAAAIGLLLIALDSEELPHLSVDISRLEVLGGLDQVPWRRFGLPRWLSRVPGYRSIGIRPHLWLRPAHAEPRVRG